MTSGSLWNYYSYELSDDANENNDGNNKEHPNDNNALDIQVVVPLKLISEFWRFINLPIIKCEIELNWSWSKECMISEISITPRIAAHPDANPPVPGVTAIQTTGATFQINDTKIYVPVDTLSINDNIKVLENIKQGLKKTTRKD